MALTKTGKTPPARIWALSSYRAGENSQIQGLAERLGFAWQHKRLLYGPLAGPLGVLRRISIRGLDRQRGDDLEGPWPDLVISAGVKNEPVCRWIKQQSGGTTRLVFLGRVWAPYELFDLIITTAQYRLPQRANILERNVTLHRVTPQVLARAHAQWTDRFSRLPEPRIGVLLGGNSGPYVLASKAARRLACQLNELCAREGASVLITTSTRTSQLVGAVLRERLTCPYYLHEHNRNATVNPYFGILATADRFLVSGDSVAMLSEAAGTGKPVRIFHLPADGSEDSSMKSRAYRLLMRWGPRRLSRDVARFHEQFVRSAAEDDLAATLARVRALLPPESTDECTSAAEKAQR